VSKELDRGMAAVLDEPFFATQRTQFKLLTLITQHNYIKWKASQ